MERAVDWKSDGRGNQSWLRIVQTHETTNHKLMMNTESEKYNVVADGIEGQEATYEDISLFSTLWPRLIPVKTSKRQNASCLG